MAGIVLEGGTFRAIFSSGVMDALLDNDIEFPYCIGVSAGISDAASYISKQKERNLRVLERYRNDHRYLGLRNLLKNKSMFGMDFVFEEVPNNLEPFDWQQFLQYKGSFKIGVTNCITGEPEYLNGMEMDEKSTMLRATCAIPMMFPMIYINDTPYYDGGIADPIPIRKSIADGNEKNLIVLTQPEGYVKELNRQTKIVAKRVEKKYPQLAERLWKRHDEYNKTVQYCRELEREKKAVVLRPKYKLKSLEKDVQVLRKTNELGYQTAMERMEEIKEMMNE